MRKKLSFSETIGMTTFRWRFPRMLETMRRAFFFRPLALALALTLLRIPILAPLIGSPQPALAGAVACPTSPDRILQDICTVPGVPNLGLIGFEEDTVEAWLTAHKLPLSDAALIYQHGRGDLRSALRAHMLARIVAIIVNTDRTANEELVFQWFRQLVDEREEALVQFAVDERDRWMSDPCNWEPDPDIAESYGLYYSGGVFCSGGLGTTLSTPQVPDKSYFLTAGFKEAYGTALTSSSAGLRILSLTAESLPTALNVAVINAGAAALGTAALVTAFYTTIFGTAGASKAIAAISIASGTAAAGAAAIILVAVLVGVIAGFQAFQTNDTLNQLAELDVLLANQQARFVDLSALYATDEGKTKLIMTFVAATLPEFSSNSVRPSHDGTDPLFFLGSPPTLLTAVLTYRDWEGDVWTATPHRGYFIQEGTENGQPVTSFSPILRFVDQTGERLTADLVGSNFLVTRFESDSGDEICYVNPSTGLTDPGDLTNCSSYVAESITLRDGTGSPQTVRMAVVPSFTSLPTSTFTEGAAKSFEITADGAPLPTISVVDPLPAGFSFEDSSIAGAGKANLIYDGVTAIGASETVVQLEAVNGRGTDHQNFTIRTGTVVEITSIAQPTFVAGKPGSFLVTTSGTPVPAIDFTFFACLPSGLSLTDNGDGTATISGTAVATDIAVFLNCSITADNTLTMDTQVLTLNVVAPPLAQVFSDDNTTFVAGTQNSFRVVTEGAETPVTISFPCTTGAAVAPAWVNLVDHGDGTATLFGQPPLDAEGAFSFRLGVFTSGQAMGAIPCEEPNFTVNIAPAPLFLSPNRAEFGPPPITGTTFLITTSEPSGLISLEGTLPPNLGFTPDEANASAQIGGFPAVGTGGVYPLILSMTNAEGTGTQNLRLQVKEAPSFESFDSAVFYIGVENTFPVLTSGFPKTPEEFGTVNPITLQMEIDVAGALPPGVSFTDANQFMIPTGTGVFTGNPDPGSEGTYPLTLTAANGILPDALLNFTLFVAKAGDVNRDGVVDDDDTDLIRANLGKTPDDPDFDHLIDTNNDGIIDEKDLQFVEMGCGDPDGDGACESATQDRDGDGIPDAEDYDPTGYLYDQDTGEILPGGRVIVSPAPASMPFDGSDGFYQFFVSPGETVYSLTVLGPPGCVQAGCPRLDPPPLDPGGLSVVLGSSEVADTGFLASAACADNPFTLTLRLGETGDEVLLNNIPFDCSPTSVPALDARAIAFALLVLAGVAAFSLRRRRYRSDG